MKMRARGWRRCCGLMVSVAAAALVAGCGSGTAVQSAPVTPPPSLPPSSPPTGSYVGVAFSGKVLAGSAPIVNASVQLYAAGTTGNGSEAMQLLANPLTTDSTGAFRVAANYSCPLDSSVLLIVAHGGTTGSSAVNADIALVSSPGICSSVSADAVYTVNELTTVASAYAFAEFLKPAGDAAPQFGASATNANGLAMAAATLANLVNVTTGTAPGAAFPSNGTPPTARMNTLADALHACVASSGDSSSACAGLYASTTGDGITPANTFDAVFNITRDPGANVAEVFGLASGSDAFSPALSVAPSDWTMFVQYTGGGLDEPTSVAVDSQGRVWVADYPGAASLFTNTGAPVFAQGISDGGLHESFGGAVDASDNFWVTNQQSASGVNGGTGSVTVLGPDGTLMSGSAGYTAGGIYFPQAVAIDATGVAWIADYGDAHVTLLNSSGVSQAGSGGYSSDELAFPVAVAVDASRNGWLADFSKPAVTRVAADGSSFTSYPCGEGPSGIGIDASNNVWIASYTAGDATLISSSGAVLSGGGYTGGGLAFPQGIAIDGAGSAWFANYHGPSISKLAGVASGDPGQALSPSGGWGADAQLVEAYGIAIDASGNVWVTGRGNSILTEFVGMGAPVKTPLLGPVRLP